MTFSEPPGVEAGAHSTDRNHKDSFGSQSGSVLSRG